MWIEMISFTTAKRLSLHFQKNARYLKECFYLPLQAIKKSYHHHHQKAEAKNSNYQMCQLSNFAVNSKQMCKRTPSLGGKETNIL